MSFISFDESIKRLEESLEVTSLKRKVFLSDALGKVVAKDVVASFNSPAYPTSAMDGYAVKFKDLDRGILTVLDEDNPNAETTENTDTE